MRLTRKDKYVLRKLLDAIDVSDNELTINRTLNLKPKKDKRAIKINVPQIDSYNHISWYIEGHEVIGLVAHAEAHGGDKHYHYSTYVMLEDGSRKSLVDIQFGKEVPTISFEGMNVVLNKTSGVGGLFAKAEDGSPQQFNLTAGLSVGGIAEMTHTRISGTAWKELLAPGGFDT